MALAFFKKTAATRPGRDASIMDADERKMARELRVEDGGFPPSFELD